MRSHWTGVIPRLTSRHIGTGRHSAELAELPSSGLSRAYRQPWSGQQRVGHMHGVAFAPRALSYRSRAPLPTSSREDC